MASKRREKARMFFSSTEHGFELRKKNVQCDSWPPKTSRRFEKSSHVRRGSSLRRSESNKKKCSRGNALIAFRPSNGSRKWRRCARKGRRLFFERKRCNGT